MCLSWLPYEESRMVVCWQLDGTAGWDHLFQLKNLQIFSKKLRHFPLFFVATNPGILKVQCVGFRGIWEDLEWVLLLSTFVAPPARMHKLDTGSRDVHFLCIYYLLWGGYIFAFFGLFLGCFMSRITQKRLDGFPTKLGWRMVLVQNRPLQLLVWIWIKDRSRIVFVIYFLI